MSLPAPSTPQLVTSSEPTVASPKEESVPDSVVSSPEPANPYFSPDEDDAMLKLVAAHTPSHRGLWDKDNGRALRMVMGEGDSKRVSVSKNSTDSESASINDEIGQSICGRKAPEFVLTLRSPQGWTSYEPPEGIARSLPVSIVPPLMSKSSTKSERSKVPPEPPLPLDPKVIAEESEEEEVEPLEGEGRGRERALQIIQARNQLPEPGMWRSLA